ncbi:glycine zipper 2TM domain-containing protein [Nitrospirillum viridazoti]|uniref:glycine zipper 2TM domain-containing protein n=1 Tax=Nitrospirillum viridazoti TaxID=3144925 RepID=UPI00067FBB1E|nr:glycine zipper 2TM domain-containing protein [Nitrospirillum amazonense]
MKRSSRLIAAAATAVVALGATLPAWADPPPWAEASGYRYRDRDWHDDHRGDDHRGDDRRDDDHWRDDHWRDDHRGDDHWRDDRRGPPPRYVDRRSPHYREFYAADVGIDEGRCDRGTVGLNVGTVVGALLGGLAGSQFGHGGGKAAMTGAGVLLGALAGNAAFNSMDQSDEGCFAQAMEKAPDGQQIVWNNPDNGARYQMTPVKTWQESADNYCREYQSVATVGAASRPLPVPPAASLTASGKL